MRTTRIGALALAFVSMFVGTLFLTEMSQAQTFSVDEGCSNNMWPIFSGGSARDMVNCMAYHEDTGLIIVGGNTTSPDFAPAANDHGFLYALDIDGNFQWGRFFYNVSYAVSDISGCRISSDGNSLSVLGMGKSVPIIMEMEILEGTSKAFYSLEYYLTSDDVSPEYKTWGAIYHEVNDYRNGQPYYYAAFTMDETLELVRMRAPLDDTSNPSIDWAYEFYKYTTEEADDVQRWVEPMGIYPDPVEPSALYLTGRTYGRGSIMRFYKESARMDWYLKFEQLTTVRAWAQVPLDRHFHACGDYQVLDEFTGDEDVLETRAAAMKVRNDGTVIWYTTFSGTNSGGSSVENMDRCFGMSYDADNLEVTVLLQTKASEIRNSRYNADDFYDTALILLDMNGKAIRSTTITFGSTGYDAYLANDALTRAGRNYLWSGSSYGFKTVPQTLTKTEGEEDYDVFTFRYNWDQDGYNCLYQTELDARDLRQTDYIGGPYGTAEASNLDLFVKYTDNNAARKDRKQEYFIPYASRYSGGFALLDTMKIPRPCAYKSFNLTSVDYYRGAHTYDYNIAGNNTVQYVATLMNDNAYLIYQNGSDASDIAQFDKQTYSVQIQTDSEDLVGVQRTIIRNCDGMNRLLELNLYLNILANTHPDFVTELTTAFTMAVNSTEVYKLPDIVDPDGNSEPEVYIMPMEAQEDQYPTFLHYDNDTRTITFKPDDLFLQGRIFYFTTIVKEKDSDTILYPYYCTVKIEGEAWEFLKNEVVLDINYNITEINKDASGVLEFSRPVNMKWVEQNFYDMFNIYWRDTTYNKRGSLKENHTLADFSITEYGADNQTIKFTMDFDEPYLLGLLIKKSDRLFIDIREGFVYEELFINWEDDYSEGATEGLDNVYQTNITYYILDTESNNRRIPLLFDWNNEMMINMRRISRNMYWVVIGLIFLQLLLLVWRKVGLLPLWILIEYMQLVAFMPIYNFRLIPYLYDAFKPALVSHLIIFDQTPFYQGLDDDFFNENYSNYWLSVGRMSQAFFACIGILIILLITHLIFFLVSMCSKGSTGADGEQKSFVTRTLEQFKYNLYIRYYMLVYFDLTFFSVMKIIEGDNSTTARKMAVLLSYILFVISIVLPVFLISIIFRRFEVLKLKDAKKGFNTLLLKIDKQSKWRIINPAYFFGRRLLTALLLTLPIENTFIFLQYVFILMSSHAYILYIVAVKPYQTPGYNSYVLANETFYSALIIAIFIFSDATPELNIKIGAGVALMSSLILLILANLIMNIAQVYYGRDALKQTIRDSKIKRAEKEALEEAEEQERRLKKKREEEEFTRLPDEQALNDTTFSNQNTTIQGLKGKSSSKKKKGGDDDLVDSQGGIGGINDEDFGNAKGRRKKKNNQDAVVDDDDRSYTGSAGPTPKPRKSKTRKSQNDVDTAENDPSRPGRGSR